MLALALVAGMANALLLVVINDVAKEVASGLAPDLLHWVAFLTAFLVYYVSNGIALGRSNRIIEGLLCTLRLEVMDKLRSSELSTVERLGQGHLLTLLSQETDHLSVAFPLLVQAFQQMVLMVMALLYLLYLSPATFLMFIGSIALSGVAYSMLNRSFAPLLGKLAKCHGLMLDAVGDTVLGAKEIRLNRRRDRSVQEAYLALSRISERLLVSAGDHWGSLILLSGVTIYVAVGVVIFVFPHLVGGHGVVVFQVIPIVMFCFGPLSKTVAQSPMFTRAEVGLTAILNVERQLDAATGATPQEARQWAPRFRDFSTIELRDVVYSHPDVEGGGGFTLGPLDISIKRGETVFLVGGNGSGKSTTLRLLTGLHRADTGSIVVDGAPLTSETRAGFREQFSAVFVNFYLHKKLYGLSGVDSITVNALLKKMDLERKVQFQNGGFTDLNLSTGQRKRLALTVAMLEDRPIYVFDEWAAEQDVHFRQFFYEEILPELKSRGKTIIAVTHDERFWRLADRVVKLDRGRVEWSRPGRDWNGQ